MEKIFVLGGTGRTGEAVIEKALNDGYEVVTIARNIQKIKDKRVAVIEGTPLDFQTVREAIKGCDAVITTLNISRASENPWSNLVSPKDLMSKSMANTIKAMKQENIKRIITMSALGVGDSKKELSFVFNFVISISNIKYAYQDHERQENLLRESDLDWTIVRSSILDDSNNLDVITNQNGVPRLNPNINRPAVAQFMVDQLFKSNYFQKTIGISN